MLNVFTSRYQQGHRTMAYPDGPAPEMPDRYHARPVVDRARCPESCRVCAEACPVDAITFAPDWQVDLGRCLFCTDCKEACPESALEYDTDYRLAVSARQDLHTGPSGEIALAKRLDDKLLRIFGRSLRLRQVSAGGCNACEADVNVLGTIGWDLSRFGIQLVASPRHADGLLITGCISENMALAVEKTYAAVPPPKIVIAVGACAIAGGPFIGNPQQRGGAASIVPVDLFIPGCPPHPLTILDGLLRLLDRLGANQAESPA